MGVTIKELADKYGYDHVVHLAVFEKDIENILASSGITPDCPDYFIKKIEATKGLVQLFNMFIDSLERIIVCVKDNMPPEAIREQMTKWGYLKRRAI